MPTQTIGPSRRHGRQGLLAGLLAVSGCLPLHAEPVSVTERQKLLQQAASDPARHGAWVSDTYHDFSDARAGLQQDARTNSLTLGYDQRITPRWTAGLALTHLSQRSELPQDNTRRRGSGLLASLYGAYAPLPFLTFPVSVGLGQINTSQSRVVEGQDLQGDFRSKLSSASAAVTLMLPLQPVFLNNSLQLTYDAGQIDSFVERWPGQQVTTPAQKTRSTQWHLSTKASVWIDGKLWPYVSLKYSRDFQRTPGESDDDQWQWGLGLDVLQGSGWMGGLGYARVVGRQGIDDQNLTLTLRKTW